MSARCWVWDALPSKEALLLLAAAILAAPCGVRAQVYTWTDADGRIHYSDVPVGRAAKRVDMGNGNTVHNPDFNQAIIRKTIPYRDIGGQIHVEGRVNGVAVDFIVDTGASLVVIPRAVASQAGIDTEGAGSLPIQTANGIIQAPLVSVDSVELGSLHADHVSAVVHDIDAGGRVGLLGMSFLGAYRMTIDHNRHVLLLEPK